MDYHYLYASIDDVHRVLSHSQPTSPYAPPHFDYGFLLWYIILMVCCMVPTLCICHSRLYYFVSCQRRAQHLTLEEQIQQIAAEIIAARTQRLAARQQNEAAAEAILCMILKQSSMTVNDTDLLVEQNPSKDDMDEEEGDAGEARTVLMLRTNYQTSAESDFGNDDDDGNVRLVSSTCAICLCAYQDGDIVTWSPPPTQCQHCFHSECIRAWLVKQQHNTGVEEEDKNGQEPLHCPCCRQTFCHFMLSSPVSNKPPRAEMRDSTETTIPMSMEEEDDDDDDQDGSPVTAVVNIAATIDEDEVDENNEACVVVVEEVQVDDVNDLELGEGGAFRDYCRRL